jgi:ornithine carbamoyltransferase
MLSVTRTSIARPATALARTSVVVPQRGYAYERPSGDRPFRRDGDRPQRFNSGDRPYGDRPQRFNSGDRPQRFNSGDRPQRFNSGDRPKRSFEETVHEIPHPQIAKRTPETAPTLMTLADRSVEEITSLIEHALTLKLSAKNFGPKSVGLSMENRSMAMIFSKRSTRTRVATETATSSLGGVAMFLGRDDIQLGVNESLYDSAKVIGSMVDGIMARVGKHEEVETLAKHAGVPVINALSDLYHPTQILADILTLVEEAHGPFVFPESITTNSRNKYTLMRNWVRENVDIPSALKGKKMAWVGDSNNISNELLVTLPRFGMEFALAAPKGYDSIDPRVAAELEKQGVAKLITYTNDPAVAVKDADILITDTWISMGQEEETATRLKAFEGYQITMDMARTHGAKEGWKFMHCLPRHKEEVDDEVFYSERSLVFPEAENRKWTIMACIE